MKNSYFIEQRFGGSFRWQLHRRIMDEHITYRLSLTCRIRRGLDVGVTTEYLERRSNVVLFEKNRLMVNFFMMLAH